jgi:hypothetical protein
MSLKDWMKKVETAQLNEFAPPPGSVTAPVIQGNGQKDPNVSSAFIAAAKPNDKVTQGILKSLAQNKSITVIGQQPGQTQNGTDTTNTNTNTSGTTTQTVGGTTQVRETGLDQVESFHDEIQVESKPKSEISDGLRYIKDNYKHECKMYEDGWGLDESMYSALVDHYYHEGKIPRKLMIEGGQALREFIEGCYAKDTGMGGNQDAINSGMLDETDDESELIRSQATLDNNNARMARTKSQDELRALEDPLAANPDKVYRREMSDQMELPLGEEMSPLERSLRETTKEKHMFDRKQYQLFW